MVAASSPALADAWPGALIAALAAFSVVLAAVGCSEGATLRADGGDSRDGGAASGGSGSVNASGGGGPPGSGGSGGVSGGHSAGGATGGAAAGGASTATGGGGGRPSTGGEGGGTAAPDVIALGVRWIGRADTSNPARVRFEWSGTGFEARFTGTALAVELTTSDRLFLLPVVDGRAATVFTATPGSRTYDVAKNLAAGEHTVKLLRETEGQEATAEVTKITVTGGALAAPPASAPRFFEVYGDSISCGYGNLGAEPTCEFSVDTESHFQSYGAVAARALGAEVSTIAVSGRGVYRNYDGSTANPLPRVHERTLTNSASPAWNGRKPAAIVLNLGTNDFAKGDPGAPFDNAYDAFVQKLRADNAGAQILCAVGPMLTSSALAHLHATVDAVIDNRRRGGDTRIEKLVFATQIEGEMGCDYHPNAAKHASMGAVLASTLREKMGW